MTPKMLPFEAALIGRKVLITGHTGFTGSWSCLWLQAIGVEVHGYSLPPETSPALFEELGLGEQIPSVFGDICDYDNLRGAVERIRPDLILHLAAQPLVRRSYREPVRTFAVNALGTAHVLEAARSVDGVMGVVCVTSDKVYKNNEWPWPYRENDPLGGKDPYSASKAAAEMVIQSYASSFNTQERNGPSIATARGGNIIGGGDWSEDRLIPDYVRATINETSLTLRYPDAIRPWQHVLALVHGYMILLAGLISDSPATFARAWNLGPQDPRQYSVREVLDLVARQWRRPAVEVMNSPLAEAKTLALDSSLARNLLDWEPVWDTEQSIVETANWYRDFYGASSSTRDLTVAQINAWRAALHQ